MLALAFLTVLWVALLTVLNNLPYADAHFGIGLLKSHAGLLM